MASSTSAPVAPPSILTASMDEYVNRVLTRIPEKKTGVIGLEFSNAGAAVSFGARRGGASGVVFVGKERAKGAVIGGRAQFVF